MATLESITPQLEPGDVVIVTCNNDSTWGDRARNRAMKTANTTHLLFIDDDDVYTPGALKAMRQFAAANPGRIGIFRMRFEFWFHGEYGRIFWEAPLLRWGNVGTPMFVVPNVREKLGKWDPNLPWGDWAFIQDTVALQGEPLFCDTVVARIRPDNRPRLIRELDVRLRLRPRLKEVDVRLGLRQKARGLGLIGPPSE